MTPSASESGRPVYLLGCGGHGRVVLNALVASGVRVAGILDAALPVGEVLQGVAVLGGDVYLDRLDPLQAAICIGIGWMPGKDRRNELFAACRARGFAVAGVVHPAAIVSGLRECGQGVQIFAGAVVQPGVAFGDNVVVNTRASIDHDCVIQGDVMIGPGAVLCGDVSVAAGAYIGAGAVVLPGVCIGVGAVVGAGSVVTKDVGAGLTVTGNPARVHHRSRAGTLGQK